MTLTWLFSILIYRNKSLLLLLLFLLLTCSSQARAAENLSFKAAETRQELIAIYFVKEQTQSPDFKYKISAIDLNKDGLNEYIACATHCKNNTLCDFYIIAFMSNKPILIGKIKSQKLIVEDTHQFGVRDILIFTNRLNDFDQNKLEWNPYDFVYKEKTVSNRR
ncbi:MAG: hypothetical protein AAF988_05660 [Pseudomonadota bacterium]